MAHPLVSASPWPPHETFGAAHLLDTSPNIPILGVEQTERSPAWHENQSLAEGIIDYYDRLDTLVGSEPQSQNLQDVLTLENSVQRIQIVGDVSTRFKLLHLDTLLDGLKKNTGEERLVFLQKMLARTSNHVRAVAADLHQLITQAAQYLKEPSDKVHQGDVQGFIRETEKLKNRSPQWYQDKGIARSIADSVGQLEACFQKYLEPSAAQKSPENQAVVAIKPGSAIVIPRNETPATLSAPVSLEKLLTAEKDYKALKTDYNLGPVNTLKSMHQKIQRLLPQIHQAPAVMRKLADRLHLLAKDLVPGITQAPPRTQDATN